MRMGSVLIKIYAPVDSASPRRFQKQYRHHIAGADALPLRRSTSAQAA